MNYATFGKNPNSYKFKNSDYSGSLGKSMNGVKGYKYSGASGKKKLRFGNTRRRTIIYSGYRRNNAMFYGMYNNYDYFFIGGVYYYCYRGTFY